MRNTCASGNRATTGQLTRFRMALTGLVALTVASLLVALPILWQVAGFPTTAGANPVSSGQAIAAVLILLAWWGAFVAAWITNENLKEGK